MRLDFKRLWLNPAADPSQGMSFRHNNVEQTPTVNVSAQLYAGGNYRRLSRPGRQQVAKVQLDWCTDEQVAQLNAWLGELLWYRDNTGLKFAGFYTLDSGFVPRFMGGSWSVGFTVFQVTVSEAV